VLAGSARGQRVNPGPEADDLKLRAGKRAVDGQADLGQAGRSPAGFGVLDSAKKLEPAGDVLVMR
jgi:hypothetical protein